VSESSIANVGVGCGSAEVPYHPGALCVDLADDAMAAPATTSFEEKDEQQTLELPSIGSSAHRFGGCVPCGFFWKSRGCVNGERCEYCHLCDSREKKRRQKAKKKFFKNISDSVSDSSGN